MAQIVTAPDVGLTWTVLYDSALSGSSLLTAYGSDNEVNERTSTPIDSLPREKSGDSSAPDSNVCDALKSVTPLEHQNFDVDRPRKWPSDKDPLVCNKFDECAAPHLALTEAEIGEIDQWTRRKTLYIPCVYNTHQSPGAVPYCGSWSCESYGKVVQQAPYSYIYFLGALTAGDRIVGLEPVPTSRFNIFYVCSSLGNVICFEARVGCLLTSYSPKCELIIHDRFNCGIGNVLRMRVGTMLLAFETVCRTLTSKGFTDEEKTEIFLFTHGGLRVAVVSHDYSPSVSPIIDFGLTCCNSLMIVANGKLYEQSSDTWSFICKRSRVKFECRGKHHSPLSGTPVWNDVTDSAGISRCCMALYSIRFGWQLVDSCSHLSSGTVKSDLTSQSDITFERRESRLLDDDCQTLLTWDKDSIHISSVDETNKANRTKISVHNIEVLEAVNASLKHTSGPKTRVNGNAVKASGINGVLTWISVIEDGQIWCSIMC
ncbi:hypothetical protein ACOME3_008720 [Neoechinorhynchus agilis]